MKTRPRVLLRVALVAALVVTATPLAGALRANMLKDLDRLERLGHYEQALFYRMSSRDMVRSLHAAWSGAPYDPQMDGVYRELGRLFGAGRRTRHQLSETRTDRRYWSIIHGQQDPIDAALAKANLTPAQVQRLRDRVRVGLP